MQFVNDDMDDDLFRRAAEEYPLNTGEGDWNKVLEKMQGVNVPQKKRRKGFLLLLTLIPLLLICTTYIKNDSAPGNTGLVNNNTTASPLPGSDKELEKPGYKNDPNKIAPYNQQLNNDNKVITIGIAQKNTAALFDRKEKQHTNTRKKTNYDVAIVKSTDKDLSIGRTNISDGKSSNDKITAGDEDISPKGSTMRNNNSATNNSTVVSGNAPVEKQVDKTIVEDSIKAPVISANKNGKEKREEAKFYLGLQAGPDFSVVKSANLNGTGYSVGLITGYNISKKFAVETGLLWDRKRYESEGQYFSTEKIDWPHVTILELSGYCDMFEIPLNIRYNAFTNSKRTWYANAGLSSYLMKKENYDYHYTRYGVYGYGNKEYKNTTNDWMSIAHLSVGFQKNIKSVGDLRIEPYVKLPLNGVGIGSMPLSSTGIYLGITRPVR